MLQDSSGVTPECAQMILDGLRRPETMGLRTAGALSALLNIDECDVLRVLDTLEYGGAVVRERALCGRVMWRPLRNTSSLTTFIEEPDAFGSTGGLFLASETSARR